MKFSKTVMVVILGAMGLVVPVVLILLLVPSPFPSLTGTLILLLAVEVARRRSVGEPKK
jgi:hypothetical protein